MRLIAHRGFADDYPENTILAARRAAEDAGMIEIDVRRCGTGELVVVHDRTIDRVTDGTGRVDELSLDELKRHEVLDSGESIPTLAAFLDAVPADVGVNVEIKEPETTADVLATVDGVENEVLVSSFETAALTAARDHAPDVPRAYIFATDPVDEIDTAVELGCSAAHPDYDVVDTNFVRRAHDAGVVVNVWTVDTAEVAGAMAELDVDGVISDRRDVV